jgi:hypothetical protein
MPYPAINRQPGSKSKEKYRASLRRLQAVSMQVKQKRKRMVLDDLPAQPFFEGMPNSRIREKEDL